MNTIERMFMKLWRWWYKWQPKESQQIDIETRQKILDSMRSKKTGGQTAREFGVSMQCVREVVGMNIKTKDGVRTLNSTSI